MKFYLLLPNSCMSPSTSLVSVTAVALAGEVVAGGAVDAVVDNSDGNEEQILTNLSTLKASLKTCRQRFFNLNCFIFFKT